MNLDIARIKHLLKLGLISSIIATIGDLILGFGKFDLSKSGLAGSFSLYADISDTRLVLCAMLGMFGMTLEILCLFAVYRLIEGNSPKVAHSFRGGIIGSVIFGPCGYHVSYVAMLYAYKKVLEQNGEAAAVDFIRTYMMYFVMPAIIIFFIFYIVFNIMQIKAIAGQYTLLPKRYWIFTPIVFSVVIYILCIPFKTIPVMNAISAAWCHIGFLWMYAGLLVGMSKAKNKE